MQDAATKAEKEADPTAKRVTDAAGDAAHDAVKSTRDKWEEVKPEEQVDKAAEKATNAVKVPSLFHYCMQASCEQFSNTLRNKATLAKCWT